MCSTGRAGETQETRVKVVMVLTGNGLKDPDTAMSQVGRPIEIGDTLAELLEVMKG